MVWVGQHNKVLRRDILEAPNGSCIENRIYVVVLVKKFGISNGSSYQIRFALTVTQAKMNKISNERLWKPLTRTVTKTKVANENDSTS